MPNYRKVARRKARKYGLNPRVFVRQIQQESGFNPRAVSPAGARGIAQIMPATAQGWGVDPMRPRKALDAAARNMAQYVDRYGGYENALRAYNAGPGNIERSKGFSETNNYVRAILGGRDPGSLDEPRRRNDGGRRRRGGTRTVTETIPGVDRSEERKQMLLAYLAQRGQPGALASLALGLREAKDTPASTRTRQVRERPGATLIVGDSLGVGTAPHLKQQLGGRVAANVKVGRPSTDGVRVLERKLSKRDFGRIILDLGTNDATAKELAQSVKRARELAPNAQIYIPTVNGPDAERKNRVLRRLAGGNVHVVDWQAGLAPDGIHATPEGYRQRARQIAKAVGGGRRRVRGSRRARGEPAQLRELFYNGPGGVNVDEGRRVGRGFVSGHTDHVHVAGASRAQTIAMARLARKMGLTVRELEPFDKVDPVHTDGSFHYRRSGAADVSGPPDRMAAFSREVARRFGL